MTKPTAVIGAVAILVVTAVLVATVWAPSVPPTAASNSIATATVTGDISPDPDSADQSPLSPSGQACLDRVNSAAGWMDLCWEVVRERDLDPVKDYYTLRVYGTVSGSGAGIRWARLRADFLGQVGDGVFQGWPEGTIDGPCQPVPMGIPISVTGSAAEEVCGRTVSAYVPDTPWAYSVTWTCVACVLPDHSDKPMVLYEYVGVLEREVPSWSIGAEFG